MCPLRADGGVCQEVLDGVQSPNAAQVLMAARGAFNKIVLLGSCLSVSGCQDNRVGGEEVNACAYVCLPWLCLCVFYCICTAFKTNFSKTF